MQSLILLQCVAIVAIQNLTRSTARFIFSKHAMNQHRKQNEITETERLDRGGEH